MTVSDGKKEAVKTYLEQTKLLVTLASAFLFAPAGLIGILKDRSAAALPGSSVCFLIAIECLFIVSVIAGYVVLGTIAGSLHEEKFDVYRPATMWFSRLQFAAYLIGLLVFVRWAILVIS